jgi:hypothetical protein
MNWNPLKKRKKETPKNEKKNETLINSIPFSQVELVDYWDLTNPLNPMSPYYIMSESHNYEHTDYGSDYGSNNNFEDISEKLSYDSLDCSSDCSSECSSECSSDCSSDCSCGCD